MGKSSKRRREIARNQQIDQQRAQGGVVAFQGQIQTYSGPIPPPEILAKYDQLIPGSAAKIIEMAHKQSEHRMDLERKVVLGELRRANAGLWCAALVSLSILAGGVVCILRGHDTAGAAIVAIDMAAVITAFLVGTVQRRKERQQKAQIQAGLVKPR